MVTNGVRFLFDLIGPFFGGITRGISGIFGGVSGVRLLIVAKDICLIFDGVGMAFGALTDFVGLGFQVIGLSFNGVLAGFFLRRVTGSERESDGSGSKQGDDGFGFHNIELGFSPFIRWERLLQRACHLKNQRVMK